MHVLGEHRALAVSWLAGELGSWACRLPSARLPLGGGTAHERRSFDVMSNRNKIRKLVLLAPLQLLEEGRQGGSG